MCNGKAARRGRMTTRKSQKPDTSAPAHTMEKREPPNQRSQDADTRHEGAEEQPTPQVSVTETVSPWPRCQPTDKQRSRNRQGESSRKL